MLPLCHRGPYATEEYIGQHYERNWQIRDRTNCNLLRLKLALRGRKEHCELYCREQSQLSLCEDSDGAEYLQYTQNVPSKTVQGGLDHVHIQGKRVRAYSSRNKKRCLVELYKKYMLLCPKPRPTPFYLCPLTKAKQTEYGEVGRYCFKDLP